MVSERSLKKSLKKSSVSLARASKTHRMIRVLVTVMGQRGLMTTRRKKLNKSKQPEGVTARSP